MEEKLAETAEKLLNYVEGMSDFAAQEAPLVAQEILTRAYLMAVGQAALGIGVFCVFLIFFRRALKWKITDKYSNEDAVKVIILLFSGAGWLLGVGLFCDGLHSLFLAVLCPRLVVLQYLKMFL